MDSNQPGRPNFQPNNYDLVFSRQPIDYFLNNYEEIEKMLYDDCIALFNASLSTVATLVGDEEFIFHEVSYNISIPKVFRREMHIYIDRAYPIEKKKPEFLSQAIPKQIGRINKIFIYAPGHLLPVLNPILNKLCRQVISCYGTLRLYFSACFPNRSLISELYSCINRKIQSEHKDKKLINCFGITLTEMVEKVTGDNFCQYYFDKLTIVELFNNLVRKKSMMYSPFDTFLVINGTKVKDVIVHKLTDTDIAFRTEFKEIVDPLYSKPMKDAEGVFYDDIGFSSFYFGKADPYMITASYPIRFTDELVPLFTKLMAEVVEILDSGIKAYGRLELRQAAGIILPIDVSDAQLAIINPTTRSVLKKIVNSMLFFSNEFNSIITDNDFDLPL